MQIYTICRQFWVNPEWYNSGFINITPGTIESFSLRIWDWLISDFGNSAIMTNWIWSSLPGSIFSPDGMAKEKRMYWKQSTLWPHYVRFEELGLPKWYTLVRKVFLLEDPSKAENRIRWSITGPREKKNCLSIILRFLRFQTSLGFYEQWCFAQTIYSWLKVLPKAEDAIWITYPPREPPPFSTIFKPTTEHWCRGMLRWREIQGDSMINW